MQEKDDRKEGGGVPIIVSRRSGNVVSKPEITQEQRDKLWEGVVKAYIQRHPEMLQAESQAIGDEKEKTYA